MHFPVSGIDAPLWLPPLVALCISFVTSMGGVSGAFLLLPFQVSILGYASPSVSATNHVFNLLAIPSGVYRYIREGRMVWPLCLTVVIGTLPGVFLGAWIRIAWLPDPRSFKLFAGFVLLYIGMRMVQDALRRGDRTPAARGAGAAKAARVQSSRFSLRRIEYCYGDQTFSFKPLSVFALCLAVGVIGGAYGIGGGSMIAPFFVAILRLPVHTIAGATLMGTFITSLAGVGFYELLSWGNPQMNVAPDWLLGSLFGLGGFAGMYLGARCQRLVPALVIKWILAAGVLSVAGRYIL